MTALPVPARRTEEDVFWGGLVARDTLRAALDGSFLALRPVKRPSDNHIMQRGEACALTKLMPRRRCEKCQSA